MPDAATGQAWRPVSKLPSGMDAMRPDIQEAAVIASRMPKLREDSASIAPPGHPGTSPDSSADSHKVRAWSIARPLPALSPTDSAPIAMEAFALQRVPALPIATGQAAMGFVTRTDLVAAAGGFEGWQSAGVELAGLTCGSVMRPFRAVVNSDATIMDVAAAFDASGDPIIPVISEQGRLIGCIQPEDLLSSPEQRIVLPSVGGMATPFGVYLSAGGISGGAGFGGLFATGALLGIGAIAAGYLSDWSILAVSQIAAHRTPAVEAIAANRGLMEAARATLEMLYLLVLIRLSSVAGFHAAEHQCVHALEAREPLTVARVRSKPRVHPRCGTNLMIFVTLCYCLVRVISAAPFGDPEMGDALLPIGLVLIFVFRLPIGSLVQQWFTTRPATDAQIRSGIAAARDLIANYLQSGPQPRRLGAFWSMGLAQVGAGMAAVMLLFQGIQSLCPFIHW